MGQYHGKFGFDTMSKLKPVFRQSRINGLGLVSPPYDSFFSRVIKFMLRVQEAKSKLVFEPDPHATTLSHAMIASSF